MWREKYCAATPAAVQYCFDAYRKEFDENGQDWSLMLSFEYIDVYFLLTIVHEFLRTKNP